MLNGILAAAYDSWVESGGYASESGLERSDLKEKTERILAFAQEGESVKINDCLSCLAYDAEEAAFEQGFIRGVRFMAQIMGGDTGEGGRDMSVKIRITCRTREELKAVLGGLDAPMKHLYRAAKKKGEPFRVYLEIERGKRRGKERGARQCTGCL